MKIACFGSNAGVAGDPYYDAMTQVGRLLARRGVIVLTGGFGGVGMEAPARGATEVGGHATGFTILGRPGNQYLSEVVDCGSNLSGGGKVEMQFAIRLANLLMADGFIIAAGDGPGSMVELAAVINLNQKLWSRSKRLAILKLENDSSSGWDFKMLKHLEEWGILPAEVKPYLLIAETPAEVVDWVAGGL